MTTHETPWWVWIEREGGKRDAFGPYPDEASAVVALERSLLIQAECEADAVDAWASDERPPADDHTVVDLNDPDHTGAHAYVRRVEHRETFAACSCGWQETGARHGDQAWVESATHKAWEQHVEWSTNRAGQILGRILGA